MHAADHEAHRHSNETHGTKDDEYDTKGCSVVLDTLDQLVFAVAINGHSIAHIREEIKVPSSAEARALEVRLQDLEQGIVFAPLRARHNVRLEGALVQTGLSVRVSSDFLRDFS